MRIIAGEHRGRKLLPPEGDVTRPITDRVKQSLFDILAPRIEGARVYDCFAGTGSMGLECLSRGASHATFFEADRSALARLAKNIDAMRVGESATVVKGDLFKWFENHPPSPQRGEGGGEGRNVPSHSTIASQLTSNTSPLTQPLPSGERGRSADLIFLDPPYRFLREQPAALVQLAEHFASGHLSRDGLVMFRHDIADELALPALNVVDRREYGGMTIEFLQRPAEAGPPVSMGNWQSEIGN